MKGADRNVQRYDKGIQLLERKDYERAAKIGDELIKLSYSGGFEIKALCLYEEGKKSEAIRLLERATQRYPKVWILWSYLGEYYSNEGRYQDALAAFHQFRSSGGEHETAQYNIAVVYGRMEKYEQALTEIDGAFGGETPEHFVLRAKASFLSGLQRFQDALSCAESACNLEPNSENLAEKAKALSGLERLSEAIEAANSSLAINVCEHAALLVMASANELATPETKLYCIKFKATAAPNSLLPGGPRVDGFLGTFWAAADSPEEALEFYRAIDRRALTLELAKHEVVEETVDGRKGLRKVHEGNTYFAVETNLAKRVGLVLKAMIFSRSSH